MEIKKKICRIFGKIKGRMNEILGKIKEILNDFVVSGNRGAAGYRKGKNPLGPPTVTDETMGIKIKKSRKGKVESRIW